MFQRLHVLILVRLAVLAMFSGLTGLCSPDAQAASLGPDASFGPMPTAAVVRTGTLGTTAVTRAPIAFAMSLTGQINLNTASDVQLQLLPGVGPATAAKIIAYRERHPFRSILHLLRIKGIGRKRFEAMRPYLTVEGETTLRPVVGS